MGWPYWLFWKTRPENTAEPGKSFVWRFNFTIECQYLKFVHMALILQISHYNFLRKLRGFQVWNTFFFFHRLASLKLFLQNLAPSTCPKKDSLKTIPTLYITHWLAHQEDMLMVIAFIQPQTHTNHICVNSMISIYVSSRIPSRPATKSVRTTAKTLSALGVPQCRPSLCILSTIIWWTFIIMRKLWKSNENS